MKVFFAKRNAAALLLAFSVLLFSSCQDVVLANIRKEVELEEGKIPGDIRSIIRFKDKYFLANGGILYKNNDAHYYGAWLYTTSPSGHVIKLAADSNYIYALVGVSAENQKEGTNVGVSRYLYYSSDGANWSLVSGIGSGGTLAYNTVYIVYTYLFCTNSIDPANRKAYFILNDGYYGKEKKAYELNGANATELELGKENASTKPISQEYAVSRSCVYYNGTTYFFATNGATTNETKDKAATMYYYGSGPYLYWGGAAKSENPFVCDDTIESLGITSDYILVGTDSGLKHITLSNGVPGVAAEFLTNASSTLSKAYSVLSILVANPELTETQTPIYASQVYTGNGSSNSAQFDHVGLWAYYPARGNWNRD